MLKSICVQILNVMEISVRSVKLGSSKCLITIFILFCPIVKTNETQTIYITVSTLYTLILSASVAAVNSGRMGLYVVFHVHLASHWACFLLCTVQSTSAANMLCSNICFSCNTASCCCTFTSACSWDCYSYLLYYRYLFYYMTVQVMTAHQSTPICCYSLSFSMLTYEPLELSLLLLLSLVSLGAHLSACHPSLSRHSHLTAAVARLHTHESFWNVLDFTHQKSSLHGGAFHWKIMRFCVSQAVHLGCLFFFFFPYSASVNLSLEMGASADIPTFFPGA